MKFLTTCPCPCHHTFQIAVQRHDHGSVHSLLWTRIPEVAQVLIRKMLDSPHVNEELPEETWHDKMNLGTDRAFSARFAELLSLDIVAKRALARLPSYEEALEDAKNLPRPLVLYRVDKDRANKALRLKEGLYGECIRCHNYADITIGSLLNDTRICKKCVQNELDSNMATVVE